MSAPRILFVCLGNICRSPTAEGVFRDLARAAGLAVEADSAGTGAWHLGEPPDSRSIAAAAARGYDLSGLRARKVERADFDRFDLILAMDRDNLAVLSRMRPAACRAELRLMLDDGTARSRRRDVPDPYLQGGFGETLELIETACRRLVAELQARAAG